MHQIALKHVLVQLGMQVIAADNQDVNVQMAGFLMNRQDGVCAKTCVHGEVRTFY